jgi:hypothetical protein
MESEIHSFRENRRPNNTNMSGGMIITHDYHEKSFAHGNWKNPFDHSLYVYYEDMIQPKASNKRDRISVNLADKYKKAYKGTHECTEDRVYKMIRWLSKNKEFVLVITSEQEHYSQIRLIYTRLSDMGLVHVLQGHTTEDKTTFKKTHHRTGIILTALTLDMFKPKSKRDT